MANKKEKIFPEVGFLDRFNAIKNHSKMTQLKFLAKMGYTAPTVIHNAMYPTHGLSPKFITQFVRFYPQYSVEWLIQGSGDMLKNGAGPKPHEIKKTVEEVPIKKREIETVLETKAHRADPDMQIIKKEVLLEDGDTSSVLWDKSMEPQITPGNLIVLRKVSDKTLLSFGSIYQVTTSDYRVIRRVVPSHTTDQIRLEALNPAFAPITVPVDKVNELHIVIGNIARMAN